LLLSGPVSSVEASTGYPNKNGKSKIISRAGDDGKEGKDLASSLFHSHRTLHAYFLPLPTSLQHKEASAQTDTILPLKRIFKPGQSTELAETSFVFEAIAYAVAILSQEM